VNSDFRVGAACRLSRQPARTPTESCRDLASPGIKTAERALGIFFIRYYDDHRAPGRKGLAVYFAFITNRARTGKLRSCRSLKAAIRNIARRGYTPLRGLRERERFLRPRSHARVRDA